MAAEKESLLREYIRNRASEADLRKLTLDLLDGIGDLKELHNSRKLDEDLEAWTEKAEFELYRGNISRTEITHRDTATEPLAKSQPEPQQTSSRRTYIWLIVSLAVVWVFTSLWSVGVGLVVLVAYIMAWLMSVIDGKETRGHKSRQTTDSKGQSTSRSRSQSQPQSESHSGSQ